MTFITFGNAQDEAKNKSEVKDHKKQHKIHVKKHQKYFPTYMLVTGKALKNIATTPVDLSVAFWDSLNGKTFKKLLKNSREKKEQILLSKNNISLNTEQPYCEQPAQNKNLINNINDLMSVINDDCECSAWNSCPNKICKVEELCPFDFSIFKITSHQRIPTGENSIAFRNHSDGFAFQELSGFCWGHATSTQRLNNLAIFQPEAKAPFKEGTEEWLKYYKKQIRNILFKNQAQIIPGYSNLLQFTSDPIFKDYFGKVVAEVWAEQAISLKAIPDAIPVIKSKKNERIKNKITELLEFDVAPTIVRGAGFGNAGSAHVIIPWVVIEKNGDKKICYRDNSESIMDNIRCITTHENYSNNFAYHSFRDLALQAKSLQKMCIQHFNNSEKQSVLKVHTNNIDYANAIKVIQTGNDNEKLKLLKNTFMKLESQQDYEFTIAILSSIEKINPTQFSKVVGIEPLQFLSNLTSKMRESKVFLADLDNVYISMEYRSCLFNFDEDCDDEDDSDSDEDSDSDSDEEDALFDLDDYSYMLKMLEREFHQKLKKE